MPCILFIDCDESHTGVVTFVIDHHSDKMHDLQEVIAQTIDQIC